MDKTYISYLIGYIEKDPFADVDLAACEASADTVTTFTTVATTTSDAATTTDAISLAGDFNFVFFFFLPFPLLTTILQLKGR